MICPDCQGSKKTVASHVTYADGRSGYGVEFPCSRCKQTGEVPDAMADWIVRGRALRDRRVHGSPYRNLMEESRLLGTDVVTLSKAEMGKIDPSILDSKPRPA